MDDDEELDNIIDIYWRCLKNGKTLNRCEEKENNSRLCRVRKLFGSSKKKQGI